jgi:hypothetical protein
LQRSFLDVSLKEDVVETALIVAQDFNVTLQRNLVYNPAGLVVLPRDKDVPRLVYRVVVPQRYFAMIDRIHRSVRVKTQQVSRTHRIRSRSPEDARHSGNTARINHSAVTDCSAIATFKPVLNRMAADASLRGKGVGQGNSRAVAASFFVTNETW